MEICRTILETREIIKRVRKEEKTIGFVPTMGALHQGHISLIQKAKEETSYTVVSIYVNPLQFGPKEDFKKYPRNFDKDVKICQEAGVDMVFAPTDTEMYPDKNYIETYIEQQKLSSLLCGRFRKGHFRGVMTVVA
ncbi:MAG: pantoate--beta-alanine ligase, partial [Planctomycetota bacterium]